MSIFLLSVRGANPPEVGLAKLRDQTGRPGYRTKGELLMKLRMIAAAVATTAAVGVAAVPAFAADSTDVTVTGGSLSIDAVTVGNFGGITLDGTAKTTTATVDAFSVTDARGTGDGWNVTMQGTQFAEHDGTNYVTSGKTLALNSLSLSALSVAANGTTSPVPTTNAGAGIDNTTGAIKIASAAVDEGMGTYDFTGTNALSLSIPASAYAKTYRSDVTVSVVSGP